MGGGQGVGHERGRPAGSAGEPQDIQEEKIDTQRGHVGGVGGGALLCPGQTRCKHGAPTSLGVKYNVF